MPEFSPHLHAQYGSNALDLWAIANEIARAVEISSQPVPDSELFVPDSRRAWTRLFVAVVIGSLGSVGMWSVVVALPVVQADFAVPRAEASLAFTLTMIGGATGGVVLGRLLDRAGILPVLLVGAALLAVGYVGAAYAGSFAAYAIAHGVIGFGSSIALGPLMADISHWFVRRRGVAVTLTSAGHYVAGTVWSPLVQHLIASIGWRSTHA